MKKIHKLKNKIRIAKQHAKDWIEFDVIRNIKKIRAWVANRTYDKFHVVHLGTKPGWSDSREMLLYANFAVLVHFVERELSAMEIGLRKHDPKKYGSHKGVSKRELGLSYLKYWETIEDYPEGHTNEHTREFAKKVRELYVWWKDVYPNRVNQWDKEVEKLHDEIRKSGRKLLAFRKIQNGVEVGDLIPLDEEEQEDEDVCQNSFYTMVSQLTEEEQKTQKELFNKSFEQDEAWVQEEQENLKKLIEIRLMLWS